ncbi:MAG: hypothetical protein J5I47_06375 [Vicingus serpentipes]|nr:hypothetical protein [Vicingus serpentipes]
MKNKLILFITIVLSINVSLPKQANAQAPQKINYQAIARDLSGNPIISSPLTVVFEIRSSSGTGSAVYAETHTPTTNQFGLFTSTIGGGSPNAPFVLSNFSTINWSSGSYYLYVEVNGDPMGATQLLSVPYALHAGTASTGTPGTNGLNCWDLNGNGIKDASEDRNNDGAWDALDCRGDSGVAGPIGPQGIQGPIGLTGAAGSYTAGSGIDLTGNIITNTAPDQMVTITGAGATVISGSYPNFIINSTDNINDADSDPNNERITTFSLNATNDSIIIVEAGVGHAFPLSDLNDNDWVINGNDLSNSNTGNVGVGTTPSYKLDVLGDVNSSTLYRLGGTPFIDDVSNSTLLGRTMNTGLSGNYNTFIGEGAGQNTTTPTRNTFVGRYAGNKNTIGSDNTMIGAQAGFNAADALNNTLLGAYSGSQLTSGGNNTAIGKNAGKTITTGSSNTFLGYNADATASDLINATAIGANTSVSANNSLVLGNNANVGIGVSAPSARFHLSGTLLLENMSGTAPAIGSVLTSMDAAGNAEWRPLPIIPTVSWSPNGIDIYNTNAGNVGIGTSNPNALLHIHDINISPSDRLLDIGNYAGQAVFSVLDNGFIGINSANPTVQFEVRESSGGDRSLEVNGRNVTLGDIDGGGAGANLFIDGDGAGNFRFMGGNVGIGISAPTSNLHINDASNSQGTLRISAGTATGVNSTDGLAFYINSSSAGILNRENSPLYLGTNGANRMVISSTGDVGIGTTTPSEKLDIDAGGSIQVDGEYTYEAVKTHYQSYAPTAFRALLPDVYSFGTYLAADYYTYFRSGGTAFGYATVGVNLPDGAVITNLEAWIWDNLSTNPVRVTLYRQQLGSDVVAQMAEVESLSATSLASVQNLTDGTIANATIDNQNYAYFLMFTGRQNSQDSRLYGAKLTYTVTQAD